MISRMKNHLQDLFDWVILPFKFNFLFSKFNFTFFSLFTVERTTYNTLNFEDDWSRFIISLDSGDLRRYPVITELVKLQISAILNQNNKS